MTMSAPFEQYPGAPGGDTSAIRVISPVRDAVAWLSIAGRLVLSTWLLRAGDSWREVLPEPPAAGDAVPVWTLVQRDPVEIRLRTISGDPVVASVTVSAASCLIRLTPAVTPERLGRLVSLPSSAVVTRDASRTTIEIPADPSFGRG